eukprot:GHUV01023406.1.p1 GENE.GHUV01023406.1~~GHUV01023406.1.p1  ORF type:complete len:345 (+),score=132.90 GHUV01023406.1:197-1231(+)
MADAEQALDEQTAVLQQLRRDNEQIDRENQLLEAFLLKAQAQGVTAQLEQQALKKGKSTRRKKESEVDTFQRLTDDEKSDIVSQAIENLQKEIDELRANGEKDIDDIRTLMEEVDMRIAETKKDTYEFKRDIIIGGEDPRTGKTNAEKVIRFFEDKIHTKEVLVEKLTLKNTTYKAAIQKLEAQLEHKEEMGEVLHLVDFDQLKIENQQYLERIDAKNKELLQLKLSTGKTVQVLNDVKARMATLMAEGSQLRTAISSKQRELNNFDADYQKTMGQSQQVTATYRKLQAQQKEADQPQIMEYIKLKHHVAELQKELGDWQRKLEVLNGKTAGSLRSTAKMTITK